MKRVTGSLAVVSLLLICSPQLCPAEEHVVTSPDKRLRAVLEVSNVLSLRILDSSSHLITIDSLGFDVRGENPFGSAPSVVRTERRSENKILQPLIREKEAVLIDRYNELDVTFEGNFGIVVRVYEDGVAYRFRTSFRGSILVDREACALAFPDSTRLTYQFNADFWSAYENPYHTTMVVDVPTDGSCSLPLLAALPDGHKVLVTEAQVEDYPGLWLHHAGGTSLHAIFPGYPLATLDEGKIYTRGKVTKHAPEIARTLGAREYPWRLCVVARRDADLLTNSLVYLLGEPSRLEHISWIKPGKVTLDWWGRRNLFGVDFVGGVNTATEKYLIDFAAHYGLEYVLLDEGWSRMDDLTAINPDLNMEEVLAYTRSRGVKVLLWAVWSTLERQWNAAFEQFSRWGISGIKVDFMNRDDQQMVNFYYRVAEETARRKMLVIFHGAYKPDGLRRTYPNAIVREGLIEFEQNAVNLTDSPEYHTLLPFVRMVTGPADYLPGTVNNAQPDEFRMVVQRPMGQGTRAHTMALCVLLESPMRMLPDAPSDYYREDTCARFMAAIPVEWDDIHVLHAKLGEYVAIARRGGDNWYVGAITNGEARDLEIDCSFLEKGKTYTLTAIEDGANAHRRAIDYRQTTSTCTAGDRFTVHLAPGGGWVGRFSEVL